MVVQSATFIGLYVRVPTSLHLQLCSNRVTSGCPELCAKLSPAKASKSFLKPSPPAIILSSGPRTTCDDPKTASPAGGAPLVPEQHPLQRYDEDTLSRCLCLAAVGHTRVGSRKKVTKRPWLAVMQTQAYTCIPEDSGPASPHSHA